MYINKAALFSNITNIVKWPFESDDNFYSSSLSVIAFLASQRFLNISCFFSLILTTTVFCSIRIYQNVQNPVSNQYPKSHHCSDQLIHRENPPYEITKKLRLSNRTIYFRIAAIKKMARIISDAFMIKEMKYFLTKDRFYMLNVARGYELDRSKNKINEDKFSKEKEKFVSLLEYFGLDYSFIRIWDQWPSIPNQEFLDHCKKRGEYFFNNICRK